jgi:DNA mismatch endonuclease (patch repair protein)
MQSNRSRDTQPELALRQLLHARGLRYRVDVRPVAGLRRRADIVFTKKKVAVFIDGCFWHGCPVHGSSTFKSNAAFWEAKIARNRERDAETTRELAAQGWRVMRFWEHDDAKAVVPIIEAAVRLRV